MRKSIILFLMAAVAFTAMSQKTMTPELLWKFKRLGGIAVSPDGKEVVYGVSSYDLKNNKGNTDLYKISVDGGEPVQLTKLEGAEYDAMWRPDGEKIAFISSSSGEPQMWEVNPDGSSPEQITQSKSGIGIFAYSPTMDHIYYTENVKLDETVNDQYPDLPEANARIIDDLMYRHWDSWHDYQYSHLFVAKYKDGKVEKGKDIMKDERYDTPLNPFGGSSDMCWSQDGKYIFYTCKKKTGKEYTESTNSEIYGYVLETGVTDNMSIGLAGYDREPVFSPKGNFLIWNSMERDGFESDRNAISFWDWNKKERQDITYGWDRDANNPVFSSDEEKIYFLSGEQATYQIFEINRSNNKLKQITKGQHNYREMAVVENGLVGMKQSMSMPTELFHINPKNGKETQLTFANKTMLDKMELGEVEERRVTTTDGKEMLVWVIYPPNFDKNKKYPTLLYCQGGPQSAVSQFFSYRWNFQLMAANDYIIVAPNRRGLPSFGREWNDQISKDWGGQNMKDYLSAIDAVSEESFVDNDRLGAIGASYGGYSVYWLAGNHDKRFKTFIAHCGLFNLESWYGATEEMFFANWDIGGPYWDKDLEDSYKEFSPHRHAHKWDTPILVIHGEKDFRVPVGEGLQAFQAAQLQDIESRFLYFPEEGHWILSPQNGVLWHRVFFDWLDKYLKVEN